MEKVRTPTPSTDPPSRASTLVLDGTERKTPTPLRQQSATSPLTISSSEACTPDALTDFKPFQMLMETEIIVEYGKKLKGRRTIHEELLRCQSQSMNELFTKAKPTRNAYTVASEMRRQLKLLVYPHTTSAGFEEEHLDKKAIPLIVRIYEAYPLRTYRKPIIELVDTTIEDQVGKRNVIDPQSKESLNKKGLKDMSIEPILRGLTTRAVSVVTQQLSLRLREIKKREAEAAKTSPVKAAAQHRILVLDSDERAVRSLSIWLYGQGDLRYDDAEHLYVHMERAYVFCRHGKLIDFQDARSPLRPAATLLVTNDNCRYALHGLADKLGVSQLAEQCLSKLANETEELIQHALSLGLTIQQLLFGPDVDDDEEAATAVAPIGNVAQVVVLHVLKDHSCPERLLSLVVEILANHMEQKLWGLLKHMISHPTALLLIEAGLRRRHVKLEGADVKIEDGFGGVKMICNE